MAFLKYKKRTNNVIMKNVGYTSYCANFFVTTSNSTGGDANMQTLVSFTSASSFVKGNNHV